MSRLPLTSSTRSSRMLASEGCSVPSIPVSRRVLAVVGRLLATDAGIPRLPLPIQYTSGLKLLL
jgi:hypothetical protein